MTTPTDLFEIKNPNDLFLEIQLAWCEYYDEPSTRLLLFLVFSLNHLREWIAGKSYRDLEKISKSNIKPEEALYFKLWDMPEFKIINELCNRGKHLTNNQPLITSVTQGFTCGSPVGDSLGQIYYRIDGVDSRKIFMPIYKEYLDWFNNQSANKITNTQ